MKTYLKITIHFQAKLLNYKENRLSGSVLLSYNEDRSNISEVNDMQATNCTRCAETFEDGQETYHCSHNCTFCKECTETMNSICQNCGETLVRVEQ
ncbi:DUF1272 domain-containing protein [Exiguobacterium sp. RIT594]|nr:DUF1272 domain-containing protein [Exiguobacterium sp. RIT594]